MVHTQNFLFLSCLFTASLFAGEKPSYIIEGSNKNDFSLMHILNVVISLLDQYDRNEINGFEISFLNDGLYFDPERGSNWWLYYFEPLCLMHEKPDKIVRIPNYMKSIRSMQVLFEMPRERKCFLIQKFIRINQTTQDAVVKIVHDDWKDFFVIGVDYFFNPNVLFNTTITFEQIFESVQGGINQVPLGREYKIFLSTNSESFVEYMQQKFGDAVICLQVVRLRHDNASEGEAWLRNVLLLARSNLLIETGSLLGKMAAAFNASLPVISLDTHWAEKE